MTLKEVTGILTRKESIHFWNAVLLKNACELIIWKSYFFSIRKPIPNDGFPKHSVLFRGVPTMERETTLTGLLFGQKQEVWKSKSRKQEVGRELADLLRLIIKICKQVCYLLKQKRNEISMLQGIEEHDSTTVSWFLSYTIWRPCLHFLLPLYIKVCSSWFL